MVDIGYGNGGENPAFDQARQGLVTAVRENGATSGVGVLAQFSYDDMGRRTGLTRGNGTTTSYAFDAVSRLSSLAHDLTGSAQDVTTSFAYHPSGQIASSTRSNDGYAWPGATNVDRNYSVNGLNQLTASGAVSLGYDARGNLTSSGSDTYTYSSENLLTGGPGSVSLSYDPAMRLFQTSSTSATTRFGYDGLDLIAEYNTSGTLLRRYVHGSGSDEPLVWYEGSGTSDRRFIDADERGSVVATADSSGNALAIDSYDEYGIPASGNSGRFQYTGQTWLAELGLYYYKARIYSPTLGRFLQTDPIGYGDGANWYNYVGSDPVNGADPSGLYQLCKEGFHPVFESGGTQGGEETTVTARYHCEENGSGGGGGTRIGGNSGGVPFGPGDITVTGRRKKTKPQSKYKVVLTTPPGAIQCFAGGHGFLAPPDFAGIADDIVLAGSEAGLFDGDLATAAVGQGGIYDVQRKNGIFYRQYTAAANFAVGAFLYGAGHSKFTAGLISDYYAARHSGNGPTPEQNTFRNLAFDVESGKVALKCGPMKD